MKFKVMSVVVLTHTHSQSTVNIKYVCGNIFMAPQVQVQAVNGSSSGNSLLGAFPHFIANPAQKKKKKKKKM